MTDASHRRIRSLALASALLVSASPLAASAMAERSAHVAGNYVSTQVTGGGVVRLELSLRPDGRALLRTGSSRYTQRPTAKEGTTTLETGTWHATGGRIVLHIEHSSTESDAEDATQYEDRTFVLAGCELRMIGASTAFTFDKQHCM